MGFTDPKLQLIGRDLWLHQDIWKSDGNSLNYSTNVPANGGSVMLKISKA